MTSSEKNLALGVYLSVALTPIFMASGSIKSNLIMFSLSSREKEETVISSNWHFWKLHMSEARLLPPASLRRNDYAVLLSQYQSYLL